MAEDDKPWFDVERFQTDKNYRRERGADRKQEAPFQRPNQTAAALDTTVLTSPRATAHAWMSAFRRSEPRYADNFTLIAQVDLLTRH
jgi:hypothetical protein